MDNAGLKMNTVARIVAACLALVAAIYAINSFMLQAKVEVYKEKMSDIDERLDLIESKVLYKETEDEPKKKGAAK